MTTAGYLPPAEPVVRPDGARHYPGIRYALVPGYRSLVLDLWIPAAMSPPPLVVYLHGGAWMVGDRLISPGSVRPGQIFRELVAAGLAVATIDYRHALEAPFPAQLHDAKAAVRWLRHHGVELGVDVDRIGVWGESAGGHLAALLAMTANRPDLEGTVGLPGQSGAVHAVVDWFGVSDPATVPPLLPPPEIAATMAPEHRVPVLDVLLRNTDERTRADLSPLAHVGPSAPPFYLVHGAEDSMVPPEQSVRLAEALRVAGGAVELEIVPLAGHGFDGAVDVDGIVARSVEYLRRHLSAP